MSKSKDNKTELKATFNRFLSQDSLCNDTAKTSCQMLLMAEYEWFRKFKPIGREDKEYFMDGKNDRLDGYEEWKALWKDRCVDIFLRHFPKVRLYLFSSF